MKEPWRVERMGDCWTIKNNEDKEVLTDDSAHGEYASTIPVEVAEHIVSCVNACAGLRKKFMDAGLIEFAVTNPTLFAEDYDWEEMTYCGEEIWE